MTARLSAPILTITGVTAVHGRGARARAVLAPTSLDVRPGESVAVVGRSGAGKSTLADITLGLRTPSEGRVLVGGTEWCTPSAGPPRGERRLVQGVPQDPSAAFVPRWTLGRSIDQAVRRLTGERDVGSRVRRAAELARLDLQLLDRRPSEVSGGQAQRAAIVRAVAPGPVVLVADEPTSALDADTARAVSAALLSITQELGIALLLVTHDPTVAEHCTRTLTITAP
ncbi:ABC transporter ATP-binding protein [Promicromonospora iranensis]|uniref:Peptide/nickel transport system ATP-binding protein n=1 Tax=Promicromonospora iranensis TaxID=1105144 RepID=A0ABU2CK14_9MICO|nr:ATP-binding cassette domain-containing protein [Promicromonospora iranensis]MDR7381682.1 peptide/nickel transport system ATP-binding protein [Promicromonospora iranensis]